MPIPVTKYRCQFKCGTAATDSKKAMESHEAYCWNNPANRTCRSCEHERYHNCGDDETEPRHFERGCKIKSGAELLEAAYESLEMDIPSKQVKPLTNCPFWEQKIKQP